MGSRFNRLRSAIAGVVPLLVLSGLASSSIRARADCVDYRKHLPLVGEADTSGDARAVALAGDHAYVANGDAGLAILRVSEPDAPLLVATLDTPGTARDVAVAGGLAVLAEGATGIVVVDVNDPESPVLLGSIDTPGDAFAVAFGASRALVYVADYASGLAVVDLGDPTLPAIIGSLDTPGSAVDVAMIGDEYAYVADLVLGVQVISVADPHAPAIVAQIPTASEAVVGAEIQGTFLYLAEAEQPSGLAVFDITNPLAPSSIGYCNTPGVSGVSVADSYAYLVASPLVYVIDITNPDQARAVGAVYGSASGLHATADHILVAARTAGVRIFDVHSPESPLLGFYHLGQFAGVGSVTAAGQRAFAWSTSPLGDGGLYVIDTAVSGMPIVGVLYLSSPLNDMAVAAGRLYASTFLTLHIIDITDPNPLVLGSAVLPATGRGVAVAGTTAFVAAEGAGLIAVDVSDPATPSVIGSLGLPGQAWDVAIAGSMALATSRTAGLFTIDINDPSAMTVLGHLKTPGDARGIQVKDSIAYIAVGDAGLCVVDFTESDHPLLIGQVETPGSAGDLALQGQFAYVADSGSGLQVIDISNPAKPQAFGGTYPGFGQTINHGTYVPGNGVQITTAGGLVCLAGGRGGFRVYPLQCGQVTAVASPTASSNVPTIGRRLVVTPNPASREVFIELRSDTETEPRTLRIYDATGRCVQQLELAPTGVGSLGRNWDGRDLGERSVGRGTYYLRVDGGGADASARLTWLD